MLAVTFVRAVGHGKFLVVGYLALLVWIVGSSISMLRPTTSRQPAAAAELG